MDGQNDRYHRYRFRDPGAPRNRKRIPPIWLSKRFYVALLLFFGYLVHGLLNQVTGISIVSMTRNKTNSDGNYTITQLSEFNWRSDIITTALSVHWTGMLFSMIGGFLAQKCGGSTILGISMMLTGGIVSLKAITASAHVYLFLVSQGLVGMLQSFCLVSTAEIFAYWMPNKERLKIMFCVINGMHVGAAIMHPFGGNLAQLWGWSMNFYVTGTICFVWSIVWLIVVKNEPLKDKQISENELVYILQETETAAKKRDIEPFKDIILSAPCWALCLVKFAYGWVSAFTLSHLPKNYITDMTQNWKNINEIYLLLLDPNIISILTIPLVGFVIDYWENTRQLQRTQIHKIIIGVSYPVIAALFVIFAPFSDNLFHSIVTFVVIKSLLSYNHVIFELMAVSIAPNHSSLLSGVTLFWQTAGTVLAQIIAGLTVTNHRLEDWDICFLSSAGILITSTLVFTVSGSSEAQPWSTKRSRKLSENQRSQCTELVKLSSSSRA